MKGETAARAGVKLVLEGEQMVKRIRNGLKCEQLVEQVRNRFER